MELSNANAAAVADLPNVETEHERKCRERRERTDRLLGDCIGWYVVLVPPQKEVIFERLLQRVGFEPLVPIEFRWRRVHARQKVKRSVPYVLASRYVFMGISKGSPFSWGRLMSMELGLKPIMADGKPVLISPDTMVDLFASAREKQASVLLNKTIVVGNTVQITRGPFAGRVIRVDNIEHGRAKATIDLLQNATELEISLEDLEPVAHATQTNSC